FTFWSKTAIVIICGVVFVRDNVVSYDTIVGPSMAPSLSPFAHESGEHEKVLLFTGWGVVESVKRGDIVTFWKPHKPDEVAVKRVVAVGGDTVWPKRGYVVDDVEKLGHGKRLGLMDGLPDEEGWLTSMGMGQEKGKVVVPHGHIWVEGDNWRHSLDSTTYGPISMGLVEGVVRYVWRKGWKPVGDDRTKADKKGASRVVEGKSEVPALFIE
ncbi:LexA/Signal peptidase, partial [Pleomassaria siparia CBS 279.74]